MKNKHYLLTLILFSLVIPLQDSRADEKHQEKQKLNEARYMLRSNTDPARTERQLTEDDFEWSSLTGKSAAAGESPKVGDSSRPYYDFKDGQPKARYISKGDVSKKLK